MRLHSCDCAVAGGCDRWGEGYDSSPDCADLLPLPWPIVVNSRHFLHASALRICHQCTHALLPHAVRMVVLHSCCASLPPLDCCASAPRTSATGGCLN